MKKTWREAITSIVTKERLDYEELLIHVYGCLIKQERTVVKLRFGAAG